MISTDRQEDMHHILREALRARTPRTIEDQEDHYRQGAVLVPIFRDNGEYKVLLTKRTHIVDEHKGQISFPGGGVEEEDASFEDTALRETQEEVGIDPGDVTLLGRMDDTFTRASSFVIHPVVGTFPYPYDFRINPSEVARLILAPLSLFLPGSPASGEMTVEYGGREYESLTYKCDGEVIWGATARIMRDLIEIINENFDLPVPGQ